MIQNVLRDQGNPLRRLKGFPPVNVPDLLIVDIAVHVHGLDIVHAEGQDIFVIDGIDNGVGMELVAEGLFGGGVVRIAHGGTRIERENRRAGEAEHVVLSKVLHDGGVHVAKLAAVALVEDDDDLLVIDRMTGVLLNEGRELLNRRDNDMRRWVGELALEDLRGGVAVGSPLLKAVILLHGLVVQILAVHDKKHLVDKGKLGGNPGRFEGGQGLARAGGVPDIAAGGNAPVLAVIVGNLDAVDDPLGGRDLIRAHDEEQILGGKDAVLRQNVQDRMAGEEGTGEVHQIRNHAVLGIGPVGGKLETVAGLLFPGLAGLCIFDGVGTGAVGIILRIGAVGDDKELDILKEAGSGPEGIPLVAVNLVEGLADGHSPAFEFHMNQRQAVDQNGDIIAIVMPGALALGHDVLVDDLKGIAVHVLPVNEGDILGHAIVPLQDLDIVLLDHAGLFDNVTVRIGDDLMKEAIPFGVGELIGIQPLQLGTEICDQVALGMNGKIHIPLLAEHANKLLLQGRLALIGIGAGRHRRIGGHHRVFTCLGNDIEVRHLRCLLSYI